jgi:hypothetical protein
MSQSKMFFIFIIGIIFGVYLAQEHAKLPNVKAILTTIFETIQMKKQTSPPSQSSTSVPDNQTASDDKTPSEKKD